MPDVGRRAAIYARYSSHNQRSESIEIQVEASRAYCAGAGLDIVAEYCDYAQTGTNTDRAEFQRMMADARRGAFDYVVIYKVTRIMRNRDEMAMARIVLRRAGVEILYAGEEIAGGSAGVLQLGMLEVLAEYESALDGERIRDGIRKNAERCMANGCVMYGWDIEDGRYVINEDEAAVVRLGVRMVNEGHTVADVWRAWAPYPTKRGGAWRYASVRKILLRRQNGGEYRYAGVVVPDGMPAIVPMDEALRCIRRIERAHKPRGRSAKPSYLLTGKLFDGTDGEPMTGTCGTGSSGRTYRYYRCRACGRRVGALDVEGRAAAIVRAAVSDPASRERIADLMDEYERERGEVRPQSEVIAEELARIERSFANIWRAIEEGTAPPGGAERVDELKRRKAALTDELTVAREAEARRIDRGRVLFWLEKMAAEGDDEQLLRAFASRVVYSGPDGKRSVRVALAFADGEEPPPATAVAGVPLDPIKMDVHHMIKAGR